MKDHSTDSPMSFEVAAGVIVKDGCYLITRRHDETHQGGLWEFPGGKREENETLIDCLQREIKEELDLIVEVGTLIKRTRYAYAFCTVTLHFFRCTIRSGIPRAIGCQDFKWVEPSELNHYPFPQANVPILKELEKSSYHQDAST
jgi:8-oxo-dGTP diphosphatase